MSAAMTTSPDALVPASPSTTGLHWVAAYLLREVPHPDRDGWTCAEGKLVTDPALYVKAGLPPAAFFDESAAWAYARRLEAALAPLNRGRPSQRSVLGQGTFEALVTEGAVPSPQFPPVPTHGEQKPSWWHG